jgi:hypothetical protein
MKNITTNKKQIGVLACSTSPMEAYKNILFY